MKHFFNKKKDKKNKSVGIIFLSSHMLIKNKLSQALDVLTLLRRLPVHLNSLSHANPLFFRRHCRSIVLMFLRAQGFYREVPEEV